MKCKNCNNNCIKKGFQKSKYQDRQRYKCTNCKCYQLENYTYKIYDSKHDKLIIQFNAEGMSISSMSRILKYSKQTIIRRIKLLASRVIVPVINETNQVYEVDELWTYVKNKKNTVWITFAMNRKTHQVFTFAVGSRNSENLKSVILPLKIHNPKKIVTDRLNTYPNIVKPNTHDTRKNQNNHIERANLTLRQHIKRLSRKTICYSKSVEMLKASFKLYLYWNNWQIANF